MERIGGLAAGGCFARGRWFVNAWQSGSACLHRIKGARIKANLRAGHINLVKSELAELGTWQNWGPRLTSIIEQLPLLWRHLGYGQTARGAALGGA